MLNIYIRTILTIILNTSETTADGTSEILIDSFTNFYLNAFFFCTIRLAVDLGES